MRTFSAFVLLCLSACSPQVIFVYADAGPQQIGDAGPQQVTDAALQTDALGARGACVPHRVTGSVSSQDCEPTPGTPVCDVYTSNDLGASARCVPAPSSYCGACANDGQCSAGVALTAQCVLIPRHGSASGTEYNYDDMACLAPCSTDSDCAFLGWQAMGGHCVALPRGSYCVPHTSPDSSGLNATCSDYMHGRV